MGKILNQGELQNSLQVGFLKDVPAGDFNPGIYFLLKNITDEAVTITVRPADQAETVETVLYPGWNPELIKEVLGAPANTLQYGY